MDRVASCSFALSVQPLSFCIDDEVMPAEDFDTYCASPCIVIILGENCFWAPNKGLQEDSESIGYVLCDLEGIVSISNKQEPFCSTESVNLSTGCLSRVTAPPLLFIAGMFAAGSGNMQESVTFASYSILWVFRSWCLSDIK